MRRAALTGVALLLLGCTPSEEQPRSPTRTPTLAAPTTTSRADLPEVLDFTGSADCGATGGTAQLRWQTRNGTQVWLLHSPSGPVSGDIRTKPGAKGPLPVRGQTSLPFTCTQRHDYYALTVFGPTGQDARVIQVVRPG